MSECVCDRRGVGLARADSRSAPGGAGQSADLTDVREMQVPPSHFILHDVLIKWSISHNVLIRWFEKVKSSTKSPAFVLFRNSKK